MGKAEEEIQSIWGRSLHVPSLVWSSFQDIFSLKERHHHPPNRGGSSLLRSLLCSARSAGGNVLWYSGPDSALRAFGGWGRKENGMMPLSSSRTAGQWPFVRRVAVRFFHPCRFVRLSPCLPCEPCSWPPCAKSKMYLRASAARFPLTLVEKWTISLTSSIPVLKWP